MYSGKRETGRPSAFSDDAPHQRVREADGTVVKKYNVPVAKVSNVANVTEVAPQDVRKDGDLAFWIVLEIAPTSSGSFGSLPWVTPTWCSWRAYEGRS